MIWWVVLLVSAASGAVVVWWLRRRYLVVTVRGRSMLPAYADGDRVLVRRVPPRRVGAGAVVVADLRYRLEGMAEPPAAASRDGGGDALLASAPPLLPTSERVVKRVVAGPGDPVPPGIAVPDLRVPVGSFVLLGDNPAESADSRHYGYVPAGRVIGVVLRHLR